MDPTVPTVVVGLAGGMVIAWVLVRLQRGHPTARPSDAFGRDGTQRDVVNIAAIRVAGVGGLGLVAAAIGVALGVPGIGLVLAVGAGLGVVLAALLILYRRRGGPMPSSGQQIGSNTTLAIDGSDSADQDVQQPTRKLGGTGSTGRAV